MQHPTRGSLFSPAVASEQSPVATTAFLICLFILLAITFAGSPPPSEPPVVSPAVLDFGKVEVGSRAVLSVIIKTSSDSQLRWKAVSGNEQWLNRTLKTETKDPHNRKEVIYDVTANTSNLPVGQYSVTFSIGSDGGSEQRLNVKIEVVHGPPQPAKLNINPLVLDFGPQNIGTQNTLQLTVSNSGGQELHWKADMGNTNWLTLDKNAGTIQPGGQPYTINVTVNTTPLTLGSSYSSTININSNGGSRVVSVALTVAPPSAQLVVTPTSLSYSNVAQTTATQSVSVGNSGGQPLTWTAQTDGASWLSIDNTGGTINQGDPAQTVNVTVDTTSLNPRDNYSASITIKSNGGSRVVSVALTVAPPPAQLVVTPTSLSYSNVIQGTTATQSVSVGNSGGQPLTWTAQTDGSPWLSIDNTGATINPSDPAQTINVTVNTTSLTPGSTYSATFTINSNGGSTPVGVTLTVAPPPPPTPTPLPPTPPPPPPIIISSSGLVGGTTSIPFSPIGSELRFVRRNGMITTLHF